MNESLKNKHRIEHLLSGKILDIGAGRWPICPSAITYDRYYYKDIECLAQVIGDARSLIFDDNTFDVVHSSHLLEDFIDTKSILTEWVRVIKPNGLLILYLPHKDYYPNVGQPYANTEHKHDFTPDDIVDIINEIGGLKIVHNETYPPPNGIYNPNRSTIDEYSFMIIAKKVKCLAQTYHNMIMP